MNKQQKMGACSGIGQAPQQPDEQVAGSSVTVNDLQREIAAEAHSLTVRSCNTTEHSDIFKLIIEQAEPIDFRDRAEIVDDSKLANKHFLVTVVEEVLALATQNQWALCRNQNFIYSFNGAYWKLLDKDDLKSFLKQCAERMGVDKFNARYVGFSNKLYEQFFEAAYLPEPKSKIESVKINLTNGTFVIAGEKQLLRPPDPADFLKYQLPFAYNTKANAPLFTAFLNEVLPDLDAQWVVAEYIGSLFIAVSWLKLEKALLLYGNGANGKSVFFEIITALLGSENVSHYSLRSLTTEPAYCRANLSTKLANYASEINGRLEADTFKQLVSGEPIEARMIHREPFIMDRYAKLIFNCNELPTDVEQTNAFFRRFLIVPFKVEIPEERQDKQLATKIIASELSGVFNWVLDGLRRLLKQGRLTDCESAKIELENYKRQSDSVRLFLDEEGYQGHADKWIPLKDVFLAYKVFCMEGGYKPVTNRNFQKRLNTHKMRTTRLNVGHVVFAVRVADA